MKKATWLRCLAGLSLVLALGSGCDGIFVDDGDEAAGINPLGGYFYLLDNASDQLIMLDHNLKTVRSWPYSLFTAEDLVQGLTFDGQALWVSMSGNDDSIIRLELDGPDVKVIHRITAPPDAQGTVRDIAWGNGVLWVLNSGSTTYSHPPELFQLNPDDGTILTRTELRSTEPRGLCFVGPNANVYGYGAPEGCHYTDVEDDLIYVFDTARLIFRTKSYAAPVGPRGVNYVYPMGICFDGTGFWTTNSSGVADYLFHLDYTGAVQQQVTLPFEQPGALVWVERDLSDAGVPLVLDAVPDFGAPTARKAVVVKGDGFRNGLTVDFGAGVAVDSVASVSWTEFTAHLTIAEDAALGPRDITVTNPNGLQGVGVGLFTVVDSDPSLGYIWFLDNGNRLLYRYSINEARIVGSYDTSPVAPGNSLQGLGFDGTDLWLGAAGSDDIVAQIDTTGGVLSVKRAIVAPPEATGTVRDMAFDGTDFWIPNNGRGEVYRVSPVDGEVLQTIPAPGPEPRGATWAEGRLYCNEKDLEKVYVWDPGSASWSAVFDAPTPPGTTGNVYPTGLTWDGASFWMCNSSFEYDYIFQIAPDGTVLNTIEVPNRGSVTAPTGIVFTPK
jgi:hypothetical protein